MQISSAASALPPHYYAQAELVAAFRKYWGNRLDRFPLLQRLHAATQVDGRYLALPLERYPLRDWGEANNCWIEAAVTLGQQAIADALQQAAIEPEDIGTFFSVSITGVASPSLEARIMNKMRLNPRMKRVPIFGLGCVAGAAGIARAADYVKAFPKQAALLLSVELCSLTIQPDDLSAANLISTGLFGDGAAAVIVTGNELQAASGPQILSTQSIFYPDTEHVMGWDISEKGFRIVLSKEVPEVVLKNLGGNIDDFIADNHLKREDIGSWVIHTGGPAVLEATQTALNLDRSALSASWDCLRENRKFVFCIGSICVRRNFDKSAPGSRYLWHSRRHGSGILL